MMRGFIKSISITSLVLLLATWCLPLSASIKPIGKVLLTNGPFIAIQADKSARSLARGSEFYQGDRLWTGPRTRAQVRFSDGAIMTLRPDTEFSVDEYEFDEKNTENNKSLFTLIKGGFRTITGLITRMRPDAYKVKTAYAIVGVRGTTYEVVDQSGLYAAAWDGTISLENDANDLLIGFGQEFNYASVSGFNSAPQGRVEVPAQLQQTVDPGLQQQQLVDPTDTRLVTGLLQDGIDPRLTDAEAASLTQLGFATVVGSQSTSSGSASDGSTGSPIFFDISGDVVIRQGGAPLSTGVTPNPNTIVAGITWGSWDGTISPVSAQPSAADPQLTQPINNEVFWITMAPATSLPTGVVAYSLVTASPATSNLGPASVTGFSAIVNFGTASMNGSMTVDAGADIWGTAFTGSVNGSTFNAALNPAASLINGNPARQASGNVEGGFSGPNAQFMGGVFNFEEVGTPSTFVNGVVVAQ